MNLKIKVVGIGGGGSNAISRMAKCKIKGVELVAVNTDIQDLNNTKADLKIQIGRKLTQGLGTGMNPEIGLAAAQEQKEEISKVLESSDMVFITVGLGGGSGTGASPLIAEIAKSRNILTVGVVTLPFSFEGLYRQKIAESGLKKLKEKVDSLIVIKNDKLLETLDSKISVLDAFWFCDDILRQAVKTISDLILIPGLVNVDFADVKAILKNSGTALFGVGEGEGEKRAEIAAKNSLFSPLLDTSPKGAKGILFNIYGGKGISLSEVEEIGKTITQEINPQAQVIFGVVQDEKLKKDKIKVNLVATGF